MNQNTISIIVILATLAAFIWLIRYAVRTGRWRYRGDIAERYHRGAVYREKSPKLFWGITVGACTIVAFVMFMVFVMLTHQLYCNAKGTPGACFEKFIHTFVW